MPHRSRSTARIDRKVNDSGLVPILIGLVRALPPKSQATWEAVTRTCFGFNRWVPSLEGRGAYRSGRGPQVRMGFLLPQVAGRRKVGERQCRSDANTGAGIIGQLTEVPQ